MGLTPEQALFYCQTFSLPALRNEQAITKKVIEAIPADKGDYRPDPCAKSAMELAWHMVAAEHRFLDGIVKGQFDFSPNPKPESARDAAAVAAIYEKYMQQDMEALSKASGEQLAKIMDFRGMFQMEAIGFVMFNLHHVIHHRGQLSTYLRPMGAKVPAIYGESYDSAEAKKAAAAN
jgi:uncharacterized damage-inducible protein DinB